MEIFSPKHACIYLTIDDRLHYENIGSFSDLSFFLNDAVLLLSALSARRFMARDTWPREHY